jgi:hypothetical protein
MNDWQQIEDLRRKLEALELRVQALNDNLTQIAAQAAEAAIELHQVEYAHDDFITTQDAPDISNTEVLRLLVRDILRHDIHLTVRAT